VFFLPVVLNSFLNLNCGVSRMSPNTSRVMEKPSCCWEIADRTYLLIYSF